MFAYIESDLAKGIRPPEMQIRFAFHLDLQQAVQSEEPLLPVCTAYNDRFPNMARLFQWDFEHELETGFPTDAEVDADIEQSDRDEAARRKRLMQTDEGRNLLKYEDERFAVMVEHCLELCGGQKKRRARILPVVVSAIVIPIRNIVH